MNILITGSSGLIGSALRESLIFNGHNVFCMHRGKSKDAAFSWLPSENIIKIDESINLDAVIHLAGAGIADGRWNKERKQIILESREVGTRLLSESLAKLKNKPKVLVSCSAIGYYGNSGEQIVDENSHPGSGFLADVCLKWEDATKPASNSGIRTVNIRIGIVLSSLGGALQKMLFPFKMGFGGIIGDGQQYMSWISINDITKSIQFIIEDNSIAGPVNLVSKNPSTNHTFTKTLGAVLNRPTLFPLPAVVARLVFGEMADALLLSSSRVIPKKLEEAGYKFIDEDLEATLKSLLGNNR